MKILIQVFPQAKDDNDMIPENMSYQSTALSFDRAEEELATLRKVVEADEKAEEEPEMI